MQKKKTQKSIVVGEVINHLWPSAFPECGSGSDFEIIARWAKQAAKADVLVLQWDARHGGSENALWVFGYLLGHCKKLKHLYISWMSELPRIANDDIEYFYPTLSMVRYLFPKDAVTELHYGHWDWKYFREKNAVKIEKDIKARFGADYRIINRTHFETVPVTGKSS